MSNKTTILAIGGMIFYSIFLVAKNGVKEIQNAKTPEELEAAKQKYKNSFAEIKKASDEIFKPSE